MKKFVLLLLFLVPIMAQGQIRFGIPPGGKGSDTTFLAGTGILFGTNGKYITISASGGAGGGLGGTLTANYVPYAVNDSTLGDTPFELVSDSLDMHGGRINQLAYPSRFDDAANKRYVLDVVAVMLNADSAQDVFAGLANADSVATALAGYMAIADSNVINGGYASPVWVRNEIADSAAADPRTTALETDIVLVLDSISAHETRMDGLAASIDAKATPAQVSDSVKSLADGNSVAISPGAVAPGTLGQVLKTTAGGVVAWAADSAGGGSASTDSLTYRISTKLPRVWRTLVADTIDYRIIGYIPPDTGKSNTGYKIGKIVFEMRASFFAVGGWFRVVADSGNSVEYVGGEIEVWGRRAYIPSYRFLESYRKYRHRPGVIGVYPPVLTILDQDAAQTTDGGMAVDDWGSYSNIGLHFGGNNAREVTVIYTAAYAMPIASSSNQPLKLAPYW